jgi:hypothetical protein
MIDNAYKELIRFVKYFSDYSLWKVQMKKKETPKFLLDWLGWRETIYFEELSFFASFLFDKFRNVVLWDLESVHVLKLD